MRKLFFRRMKIGHYKRIPIWIDFRWLFVFLIMPLAIGEMFDDRSINIPSIRFLLGFFVFLGFFGTLLIHEFMHTRKARKEGSSILGIVIYPFGGVAQTDREPVHRIQYKIAVQGPLISALISIMFFAFWVVASLGGAVVISPIFLALFAISFLTTVFNILPGYPLDFGRIYRSRLMNNGLESSKATKAAGAIGRYISIVSIVLGAILLVMCLAFSVKIGVVVALWTLFIGVFLYDSSYKSTKHTTSLTALKVNQVLEHPMMLTAEISVDEYLKRTQAHSYRQNVFPIVEKTKLVGFVRRSEIKDSLRQEEWKTTLLADFLIPIKENHKTSADSSVASAMSIMKTNGLGLVCVENSEGEFEGFVQLGRIRRRNTKMR